MQRLKKFLGRLGPGFITGSSDDDPAGIATYSQTGSIFGYSQLWLALFTFPFQTVIQEICGRVGMVTGKGLAGVIRKFYSKKILYSVVCLLLIANIINIGADLGAMAASAQLIIGLPFIFWLILMTAITLILEVVVSYKTYSKFLKFLTFSLFAYIITVFVVKQDWSKILYSTLVPNFQLNRDYLINIVAVLGTTISPYLFFWQAGQEVEEEVEHHKLRMMGKGVPKVTKKDIREMRLDTAAGMFFSNLVMFFIIITAASTLNAGGIKNIETAAQAAAALRPFAGEFAFLLFAAGIVGTGLLAVPILAGSASYALTEALGWKEGLYRKFTQAQGFYAIIIIATLVGFLINFTKIPPFRMLYYTAVINGICAPPLIMMILLISNNNKIMGKFTNGHITNIMGWLIAFLMSMAGIFLLLNLN